MGNQKASSSISSSPKPEKNLKSVFEAIEEEEETMRNLKQGSPQDVLIKKNITERPNRLGVFRTENDLMKKHPTKDEIAYICNHCNVRFTSFHALDVHLKTHKKDLDLEKQVMKMDSSNDSFGQGSSMKPYNSNQDKPNSVFGGFSQAASPNDKNIVMSLDPLKPIEGSIRSNSTITSVLPSVTNVNHTVTTPHLSLPSPNNSSHGLSNDNDNLELSPPPFKPKEDGNNNNNMNVSPPAARGPDFIDKTTYGTFIRDYFSSYNYHAYVLSDDNIQFSFGPFESTGSSSSNSNNNIYTSLNGGVTRGNSDMNTSVVIRPKVSYPFLTEKNSYGSSSRDRLPSDNYPQTTMFPLQENASRSSFLDNLVSKEKPEIIVLDDDDDDDDKEKEVAEDDENVQMDEEEAKSWGRDLTLSL